jgi:hypothetical protein
MFQHCFFAKIPGERGSMLLSQKGGGGTPFWFLLHKKCLQLKPFYMITDYVIIRLM